MKTPPTEVETNTPRQATEECRDSVLGLLHQTAELLVEKGEKELATTYLEAALNCFCCWEPKYIPKRTQDVNWSGIVTMTHSYTYLVVKSQIRLPLNPK